MKKLLLLTTMLQTLLFASFNTIIIDSDSLKPISNAIVSDSIQSVKSDENGSFSITSGEKKYFVKAYGYRPYSFASDSNATQIKLEAITVRALYLTFWGASNNSKTLKKVLNIIPILISLIPPVVEPAIPPKNIRVTSVILHIGAH